LVVGDGLVPLPDLVVTVAQAAQNAGPGRVGLEAGLEGRHRVLVPVGLEVRLPQRLPGVGVARVELHRRLPRLPPAAAPSRPPPPAGGGWPAPGRRRPGRWGRGGRWGARRVAARSAPGGAL